MPETHGVSDNPAHQYTGEPNIAMSWIRLPEALGGTLARVPEITPQSCGCEKHTTVVYALEGNVMCYYCETGNGFAFVCK